MKRLKTGVEGLDAVLCGGFVQSSSNLISGGSGTGKTILAVNFLLKGATSGEPGLLLTLEEGRASMLANMPSAMRKEIERLADSVWFLDLSEMRKLSSLHDESHGASSVLDVEVIAEVVQAWAREKKIKRIVIDGIAALGLRYGIENEYRGALFRLTTLMKDIGLTSVITTEINEEGRLSRYTVEEYVTDSITIISYKEGRRTLEVYKMRGSAYLHGKHSFEISDSGYTVYPRFPAQSDIQSRSERVKVGIEGLDDMLGGGLMSGDVMLVTGPAGTGKSIFGLQFINEGAARGKKVLIISFEEPPSQMRRNAISVGIDLAALEKKGLVQILYTPSTEIEVNKHLSQVRGMLEGVSRVMVDSASDYEVSMPESEMKTFLSNLVLEFKKRGITSILTSETPELIGASHITNRGVSFIVDTIIMMRFVEMGSEMKKALNILKMRGSRHVREIREYSVTDKGISIGKKFEGVEGVMTGSPRKAIAERVEQFFKHQ